ncbi:hypothetical protein KKA15_04035 [Patescibacteria group bacterium]|nr:hypothetical protein [Patescibacteria group bacterium]
MVNILAAVGATEEQQLGLTQHFLNSFTPVEATVDFVSSHIPSIKSIWIFLGTHNGEELHELLESNVIAIPEGIEVVIVAKVCSTKFPQMLEIYKAWGETEGIE